MSAGRAAVLALVVAALAGCEGASAPRAIDQPGVTSQGSGGSAGAARGRIGLRLPFPL